MLIDKNIVKKNKEDELCETKIGKVIVENVSRITPLKM